MWMHAHDLVSHSVHLMCSFQSQQSGLLDLNAGLRNIGQDGALLCQRLAKRHSLLNL